MPVPSPFLRLPTLGLALSGVTLLLTAFTALGTSCAEGLDPVRLAMGGAATTSGTTVGSGGAGGGSSPATTTSTGGGTTTTTTATTATSSTSSTTTTTTTTSSTSSTTTTTTSSSSSSTTTTTSSSSSTSSTSSGGPTCLQNIPASCPDCQTQNASDMPKCEQYLACYAAQNCNPANACGQNSGVCGVNTIGGGNAPMSAAVTTYNCACP